MNRSQKVAKNTAFKMVFKIVTILSSFVLRTVFIYSLGDEYTGLSSLFKSILTVLSFVELGMGTSITYALYKPIVHNDKHKIAQLLKIYRQTYTIIGFVILGIGLCIIPFLDRIVTNAPNIKENITYIYIWQLANTTLSYLFVYRITLLTASQEDHLVSKLDSALYVIRTIAEVLVLAIFKSYWAYLIVNSLYTLFRNIALSTYSTKKIPVPSISRDDVLPKEERKEIFKNVGALAIYKISDVALEGTDSIIISSFIGTGTLGIYSNYYLLMTTVKYAVDQVFSAAVPSIGNYKEFADNKQIEVVMNRLTFLAFWIATFCTAAFLGLVDMFVGNIWLGTSRVLPFSIVLAIFVEFYICLMTRPSRTIRESCGLFVQGKYRPLVMAIINIVVSIILAYRIGLLGVILGTIIARVSTQLWYDPLIIYRKLFNCSSKHYMAKMLFYFSISAVIITLTVVLTRMVTIQSIAINFICKTAIVVIVPNIILYLIMRKSQDYDWAKKTFKNVFSSRIKAFEIKHKNG